MKKSFLILGIIIAVVGILSGVTINSLFFTISNPISFLEPYNLYIMGVGAVVFLVGLFKGSDD